MRLFHPLPSFSKTYARSAVWSDSTRHEGYRVPLSYAEKMRLYQKAVARFSHVLRGNHFLVLWSLLFDFHNARTGRLDPSLDALARKNGINRDTVAVCLKDLKRYGLITWVRRCVSVVTEAGHRLAQITNAYAVRPLAAWVGGAVQVALHPSEWGAAPVMPTVAESVAAIALEGHTGRLIGTIAHDPANDKLSAALSRINALLSS